MSDPTPRVCGGCQGPVLQSHNYCRWDCHVAATRKSGGVEHTPNGLPIKCIRHDGLMLECEGGDHPTYRFPVTVEGPNHEGDHPEYPQTHALIYADASMALTLYECCYAMWSLGDGSALGGSIQDDDAKLSAESLAKILGRAAP